LQLQNVQTIPKFSIRSRGLSLFKSFSPRGNPSPPSATGVSIFPPTVERLSSR
jgi:hypothetical protein